MPFLQLSPGLHSVVEHVELNKSGWWDLALRNVVKAAAWIHGQPFRRAEVGSLLAAAFGLEVAPNRINPQTDALVSAGAFVSATGDYLRLSETASTEMSTRIEAAELNEAEVRSSFESAVATVCQPFSPSECWDIFNQEYMLPVIIALGARTAQLMGKEPEDDADLTGIIRSFLQRFDPTTRSVLRSVISDFLSPTEGKVRRYVMEHLDTYFLIQASGLNEKAIAEIKEFGQKPPTFKMFLDTNFLFSVLELHENPSNEAALLMIDTLKKVGQHLSINLFVLPSTVDEMKHVLIAAQNDLRGLRLTPSLAIVANEVGLSGIALRFARANLEAGESVSATDYFSPYLKNLNSVLRGKGITVYNTKIDTLAARQDVIDDLHELSGDQGESERERQRLYNAALHDSILWHFVDDLRPGSLESPLEAIYWVVTNDYHLLGFDRQRRRDRRTPVGVCMHPSEMVPILQLWEPRTIELEQAMMSGVRLPFMFYDFDAGSEPASLRILNTLSRFENIGDLEPATIKDIVLSDAVRSRMASNAAPDEDAGVIREALIDEYTVLSARMGEVLDKATALQDELRDVRAAAASAQAAAAPIGELDASNKRTAELEAELREANERNVAIARQLKSIQELQKTAVSGQRQRSSRVRAALSFGLGGAELLELCSGRLVGSGHGPSVLRFG